MRNIEKYKDNIVKHINECGLYQEINKIKNGEYAHNCCDNCDECYDDCIRWLAEEYKEPVLDEEERKYLSEVIRPFRNEVSYIKKDSTYGYFIVIAMKHDCAIYLPTFPVDSSMYKGMELFKKYTIEELGL